ncbi:MAG: response regulator [Bacteroidota bacterium]
MNSPRVYDIIHAEDDADDILFFSLAIEEINVPVKIRHAKDGDVLFQLLHQSIPDLLFLDIHMPCKNGIACVEEIRRDPRYDLMPILMITSNDFEALVENAKNLGANMYIQKPNTFDDLVEKLRYIFSVDWSKEIKERSILNFVI